MLDLLLRVRSALAERYTVDRELGRGGMATVFLAEDRKHARQVAIKVIHPDRATHTGTDRFLREIRVTARLQHPHILPLHDSGSSDGLLYYVMPRVEGETLRDRLDRETRLSADVALRIAHQIADALAYAHAQGIVHRDVKPENILLSGGHALLADFGISYALHGDDASVTTTGVVIGTLDYLSPEQLTGGRIDGRTDQYALACVVYEMLSGRLPFERPQARERLYAAPRPLSLLREGIQPSVDRALERALSVSPQDRFADMAEFTAALSHLAEESRVQDAPNNLPSGLTSFVGREPELVECRELLRRARLLSLIGVGGTGKTRLAVRLGEEMLGAFPDGVWFVDLAPITEPERVAAVVADVLDVRPQPGRSHTQAVVARLAPQRTLLLLDNAENVLFACAELAEALLRACGDLKILVTSREALGSAGELTYVVPPLSMPPAGAAPDSTGIDKSDAVRLFVERAAAVRPGFRLTHRNATKIAEICRRLDGIPLAIELAAARVRMLSVEEIHDRLVDRFRLLVDRTQVAARHRALLATLQWSYEHLLDEERRLFRALAVFAGSWTLSAALALFPEAGDEYRILDLLTRLVDKSLVLVDPYDADSRYRLLETVRQFAEERLEEAGEKELVRRRHLDYFAGEVAAMAPRLRSGQQAATFARLQIEHEDILAALAWCEAQPDGGPRALAMASSLWRFWYARGHGRLGLRALERLLARPDIVPGKEKIEALLGSGLLLLDRGDYPASRRYYEEALATSRAQGDRDGLARALNGLGAVAGDGEGRYDQTIAYFQESLALHRELGDKRAEGIVLSNLGEAALRLGRLEEARTLCDESLRLRRETGDRHGIGLTQLVAARASMRLGNTEDAIRRVAEALERAQELGQHPMGANALDVCAELMEGNGDRRRSALLAGAADALREIAGSRRATIERSESEALRVRLRRDLGEIAFATALEEGRALAFDKALTLAHGLLVERRETTAP